MKRLRRHQRVDMLGNQQRATSMRLGRMIYLALLVAFSGSLAYYFVGERVVLSLEGTLLNKRAAVDAAYVGKVTEVYVKEGQRVVAGQKLARLESFDMVRQLADMRYRAGELAIRGEQARSRIATVLAVAPLARRAAEESDRTVARLDVGLDRGIVSSITRNNALRSNVEAADRLAELTGQDVSTQAELAVITDALAASKASLAQLERIYDDGYLRAPTEGIVGAKLPPVGDVVQIGEELMQVNGGEGYLLAYLPDQYMFSIRQGMPVSVSGAGHTVRGEIEEILGVAEALPAEFQAMFRPRDRSRLVRVALPVDQPFAATQKVTVGGCAFGWCWVD
jgi:multidrug resistance efflux pump